MSLGIGESKGLTALRKHKEHKNYKIFIKIKQVKKDDIHLSHHRSSICIDPLIINRLCAFSPNL